MVYVKKNLFTTALACVFAATALYSSVAPAFAAEGAGNPSRQTEYPSEFLCEPQFSRVSDYAINGESIAVAEGTKVYLIETDVNSDKSLTQFDCGIEIARIDYSEENLYICDVEGNVYRYPDVSNTRDYVFESELDMLIIGDSTYLLSTEGLKRFYSGTFTDMGTGFTRLKKYGDSAYVLKENVIYRLNGAETERVSLEYADFSAASEIYTGDVQEILLGDYTVNTVTVNPVTTDGKTTYCTEVDLSDVSGEKFTVGNTLKINGVRSALAIAETGNATIIVMNEGGTSKSFITLTTALTPTVYSPTAADTDGGYVLTDTKIYSRPYMCGATQSHELAQGTIVSVTEKFSLNFIDAVFYKVSYNDGENEITGYVAANYISPYSFSAEQNKPENIKDEFTYKNEAQTVIVVLLIIGLVIIAIAYLTVVGTRGNGKKKRKRSKERTSPPPEVSEE